MVLNDEIVAWWRGTWMYICHNSKIQRKSQRVGTFREMPVLVKWSMRKESSRCKSWIKDKKKKLNKTNVKQSQKTLEDKQNEIASLWFY